jgi:hypothetical protein
MTAQRIKEAIREGIVEEINGERLLANTKIATLKLFLGTLLEACGDLMKTNTICDLGEYAERRGEATPDWNKVEAVKREMGKSQRLLDLIRQDEQEVAQ